MDYLFYIAAFIFILLRISKWIKQQYAATLEETTEEDYRPFEAEPSSPSRQIEALLQEPTEEEQLYIKDPYALALPEEELKKALQPRGNHTKYNQEQKDTTIASPSVTQHLHSMLYNKSSLQTAFVLSEVLQPKYKDY